MKAVNKFIIIKSIKEEVKPNKSGLILTEKHQDEIRYRKAEVRSVGNYVEGIIAGDSIYYDRHAGYGIEYEGEYLQVIKEQDVVVVL
jgi:co-chaperonin GroES (HSP10)